MSNERRAAGHFDREVGEPKCIPSSFATRFAKPS